MIASDRSVNVAGDFARWSKALTWVLSLELNAHRDEIAEAFTGLSSYVETLIEERRRKPEDDLLTRLIQAEEDGDHLSLPELQSLIMSLLFAGFDTTRNQLGIAMTLFAANPEQWALLARRPDLRELADAVTSFYQPDLAAGTRETFELIARPPGGASTSAEQVGFDHALVEVMAKAPPEAEFAVVMHEMFHAWETRGAGGATEVGRR